MELFGSVFGSILGVFGSLIGWIRGRDTSKNPSLRMKLKEDRRILLVENTGYGKAYNVVVELKKIGIHELMPDIEVDNSRGVGFAQYKSKVFSIEKKSIYVVKCMYENGLGRKMKVSTLQIKGDDLRLLCGLG